jgi:hypothetical protein
MNNILLKFINKSGKMAIADPCVFKDTVDCIRFDKVRRGIWCVTASVTDEFELKQFKATHEDARIMTSENETHNVLVQTEQMGFFDDEDYRNDKVAMLMPREPYKTVNDGDKWYSAMSHITNTADYGVGVYECGAIADISNGVHKVIARKSIDGTYVEFEIK